MRPNRSSRLSKKWPNGGHGKHTVRHPLLEVGYCPSAYKGSNPNKLASNIYSRRGPANNWLPRGRCQSLLSRIKLHKEEIAVCPSCGISMPAHSIVDVSN